MRNNTYDTTGYKFGFIVVRNNTLRNNINLDLGNCKTMQEAVDICTEKVIPHASIIDFDSVDGLSFEEMFEFPVFNKNLLLFCIYSQVSLENHDYNNILGIEFLTTKGVDNKEKVDDYLCSYLEDEYNLRSSKVQGYMKCFLERYKYGSKYEVDKVLEKINNN